MFHGTLVSAIKVIYLLHGNSISIVTLPIEGKGSTYRRPVAIIKIWNPEIENKKLPKLFFWNYLWKLFRKPKLHFQKKIYFHGIG